MKNLIIISAFIGVVSLDCLALGPVPNGHYNGTLNCWSEGGKYPDAKTEIVVSDNELIWSATTGSGTQVDKKKFTFGKNGYFTFTSNAGKGEGYCGSKGCHYSAVLNGLPGEDTFTYSDGKINLLGSAGDGEYQASCEATYR